MSKDKEIRRNHAEEKSRTKSGTIWMLAGLLLLAAAFSLTLYNIWDGHRAGEAARLTAEKLKDRIRENVESGQEEPFGESRAKEADRAGAAGEKTAEAPDIVPQMSTTVIDGNAYIGLLEIPSQGLSLPVMAEWDYEKLKTAPCRYSGSYYQNNLVIAGHNYARHFSPIKWLEAGSDVYFTAVGGSVYHYTVEWIETLRPRETEAMESGDWDLTLFTCTTGGGSRCAVRCVEARE